MSAASSAKQLIRVQRYRDTADMYIDLPISEDARFLRNITAYFDPMLLFNINDYAARDRTSGV